MDVVDKVNSQARVIARFLDSFRLRHDSLVLGDGGENVDLIRWSHLSVWSALVVTPGRVRDGLDTWCHFWRADCDEGVLMRCAVSLPVGRRALAWAVNLPDFSFAESAQEADEPGCKTLRSGL